MKSRTLTCIAAMALFAALATPIHLAAQKQMRYAVIDLGTLGGTFSQAFGINNNGSVVGFGTLTGDTALHAFLWRKGVMTDLGTLVPTDTLPASGAYSINDNDEAVGFSETSVSDPQNTCGDSLVCLPVVWRDKTITALPTLGGTDGSASAINNRGQVVGIAETGEIDPTCQTPVIKPAVWEKGRVRALPTAPLLNGIVGGGPGPAGNNDRGQVVGITNTCDFSAVRPLIWEKKKIIDMGNIGPGPAPVSINNKAQVGGTYLDPATGGNRAFFWQDGVVTDLGTLPGDVTAEGGAINDRGQIVGQSCSTTSCRIFIWQNGIMTDVNALIPANASLYPFMALGINSVGEIVGVAFDKNSGACCHGFLAIPDNSAVAESATATPEGQLTPHPNIVIPENVRKLLERGLGRRYHIPGLGASPRD
jgi:probable HAF family extracellular repeat protein